MPDDDFEVAQFPIRLNLPDSDTGVLTDAKEAVRREFRDSVKWKRIRCRSVTVLSESKTGTVFILDIGHAVEFEWTWEGAVAFRPLDPTAFAGDPKPFFNRGTDEFEIEDAILWSGEVLEVDEASGCIFVCVSNHEYPPTTGSFYVRPFEFLAFLDAVYHDPSFNKIWKMLPRRLLACAGGTQQDVNGYRAVGLPELKKWWGKSWSILWGPPGTGKTYTVGQQVANALADSSEHILVASTTNRATDAAAVAIGRAAKQVAPNELSGGKLLRIGKGTSLQKFESQNLTPMLEGTETEYLAQIDELSFELAQSTSSESKALVRKQIKEIREQMRDSAQRNFLDQSVRTVVSTAFRAMTFLWCADVKDGIGDGYAPFTTIFVDEAGLVSRAAVAALSLLASRRVVLVGDSRQLAPISRISRVLPTNQMIWLANSGLSHLENIKTSETGVHVLREQHRMHADVCSVVSSYQYDGMLMTAPEVKDRAYELPEILSGQTRTIWYVLDDDGLDLPSIRAERGPGNRSWIRAATRKILDRLFSDVSFCSSKGLFISPFKAQAKDIAAFFAMKKLRSWSASTVHSQQGSEADVVIFDTVNAGSYNWPYDEWKRLVNVALSRSREAIIVLSSRAEMDEPYLRPLLRHLAPRILRKSVGKLIWEDVPAKVQYSPPNAEMNTDRNSLGVQLSKRKELRPVLSNEQERLCGLKLDGKPRLVRGVAGSGKTVVLAHWLVQTVKRLGDQPNIRIWVVFANRSLQSLIGDSIALVWENETEGKSFPWERVSLKHIREVLADLLPEVGLSMDSFEFEYDDAAFAYLARQRADSVTPRCDALFIDEAQDMGPDTLKVLTALVRRTQEEDVNSRSVNIFYDNAQNIYGRGTPNWKEIGLGMSGRSTVMKESFRSTKPITEFALNVLYRLQSPDNNADHRELCERGLIESTHRNGSEWWTVRFNQIHGPKPTYSPYTSLDQEFDAIAQYCRKLIQDERVQPSDICLLYNGPNIRERLKTQVAPQLAKLGVELSVQTNKPFVRGSNILLATTANSYKGYDAEVIIIPAVDQFTTNEKGILANNLYVAMTRARSILTVFSRTAKSEHAKKLHETINDCLNSLHERPTVEFEISPQDDLEEVLDIIGHEHRKWLRQLWSQHKISQEPLITTDGEMLAQPLFWLQIGNTVYACFRHDELPKRHIQRLENENVKILRIGQSI